LVIESFLSFGLPILQCQSASFSKFTARFRV
jgi:hypothetical protein